MRSLTQEVFIPNRQHGLGGRHLSLQRAWCKCGVRDGPAFAYVIRTETIWVYILGRYRKMLSNLWPNPSSFYCDTNKTQNPWHPAPTTPCIHLFQGSERTYHSVHVILFFKICKHKIFALQLGETGVFPLQLHLCYILSSIRWYWSGHGHFGDFTSFWGYI